MAARRRTVTKWTSPRTGATSWRVRYRTSSGTEKSETFYTEAAAEEFAGLLNTLGYARALAYIDEQNTADGRRDEPALTLDDLFGKWLAWKGATKRDGTLQRVRSSRTLVDYRRQYDARISPTFGARPVTLISGSDVQEWVEQLAGDLEPKTVVGYHGLLHAVFLWGMHPSRALVIHDPCAETDLPKVQRKKPKGLRPDEWAILHRAAEQVDPAAADLLLFMASTGWRWSEAVAVPAYAVDHWTDDDGRSHTYVTMGRVLRREADGFAIVDDAKSDAGSRRVRITGPGETMLLRRIYGKPPESLVFTTKRGGRWDYTHFHQRTWSRPPKGKKDVCPRKPRILEVARELGLNRPDLTLHWLRHTHVGMLILAGEPLTAIQRRLGHASIKTTSDTYGRMIEDASADGLERVAAMLGGMTPREITEA